MPTPIPTLAVHVLSPTAAAQPDPSALSTSLPPMRDAIVGFTLTGVVPIAIQERLDAQARFLACLPRPDAYGPSAEIAYALHHSALPPTTKGMPVRISTALLVRISDWDWARDEMRLHALAVEVGNDLRALLSACLPAHRFAPVTSAAQLERLLTPFKIMSLVEVRPPRQAISPRLAVPVPLSGFPSLDALTPLMARETQPCLLSVGFQPVRHAPTPLTSFIASATPPSPIDAALNLHMPLTDWPSPGQEHGDPELALAERVGEALVQHWQKARSAALHQPFQLRVQLASAGRLSAALTHLTAAEFGGPSQACTPSFWSSQPSSAIGAELVTPRTTSSNPWSRRESDLAIAEANLRSLRTHPVEAYPAQRPSATRQATAENASLTEAAELAEPIDSAATPPSQTPAALTTLASLVNLSELARLLPFPSDAPWLPSRGTVLSLPYLGQVSRGARIGVNTDGDATTPVRWPLAGRMHHAVLVGGTGMGKSTLVERIILDDILNKRGVIVIDPHDEMVERLLGRIPAHLADKVILLDVADSQRPLGINLLDLKTPDERAQMVTRFLAQLRSMYDPHDTGMVGPVAMMMLRHGMQAVMGLPHGGTLLEVYRLFTDDEFLDQALPHIQDYTTVAFFQQLQQMRPADRAEYVTHGISKLSEWVSDPMLRRIVAQRTNSFDFAEALNSGAIVLCQLRSGVVGADKAAFIGHLMIPMIYQAALSRLSLPANERRPAALYIDEAGTFTGDPSIARMLSECRKATLSVNLIFQYIAQADPAVREAVLANAGSIFSFRLGPADAAIMQHLFAPSSVTAQALMQLPRGIAYSQIMLENGQRSPVFTLETELLKQRSVSTRAQQIRALSAQRYGRARVDVEAALESRRDASRWVQEGDTVPDTI